MQNVPFIEDLLKKWREKPIDDQPLMPDVPFNQIGGGGESWDSRALPQIPSEFGNQITQQPPPIEPYGGADRFAGLGTQTRFGLGPGNEYTPPPPITIPDRTASDYTGLDTGYRFGLGPGNELPSISPSAPAPSDTAVQTPSSPYDFVPNITAKERALEDVNNPENYRGPTYQNTDPKSPDFGAQSSDPDVVKSWGNNAARIDEGGKRRNKKWSLLEKIGSAALGWAQGGLLGGIRAGTDRNYFPKLADQQRRQELLPQIAQEQQIEAKRTAIGASKAKTVLARQELQRKVNADKDRFDRQTRALDIQGQRLANEKERYKVTVDENGLRWREFLNDPTKQKEPVMDPVTREQDQDPNFKLHDYRDPNTGTIVQIRGDKLAQIGGQIVAADAMRQQQVNMKQVDLDFDAQKTNAANKLNYANKVIEQAKAMAIAGSTRTEDLTAMNGLVGLIQESATKLDGYEAKGEMKLYEEEKKNFDKLYADFNTKVAAAEGGTALIDALKKMEIEPPKDVVPKKIAVVKVGGGGKKVPLAQDSLRLYQ
jgi:hypothetical protein